MKVFKFFFSCYATMLPVFIVKHSSRTSLIYTDQQTRGGDGDLQISMFTSKHENTRVMVHQISVGGWRWQKRCQGLHPLLFKSMFLLAYSIAFRKNRIRLIMETNNWDYPGKQKTTQEGCRVSQAAVKLGCALQRDHVERSKVVAGRWLVSPR